MSARPCSRHVVIAIGPSTASMMSARLIVAGGRASRRPPPVPRSVSINPAAESLLTSFCTVGNGTPVSSASSVAFSRPRAPHRPAAAPRLDRKSVVLGTGVSVRVDFVGRLLIQHKNAYARQKIIHAHFYTP